MQPRLAEQMLHLMEQMPKNAPQGVVNELSRGELFILNFLHAHGEPVRSGDISASMHTSTARTAAALSNMEKKGWVRREPDARDRRYTLVHLTGAGSRYVGAIRRQALAYIERILAELGERDALEYLRIQRRILDIVEGTPDKVFTLPKEESSL